ncbi:hypothetical protein L2E82_35163 [Cichorium intybus]|uniref:Uncharacterized protein n=1 Tax=Cichorium intybus TaxID=13427 RepID=A0ACB9BNB8_CICIN|nr:hypothetical protein L2E82_35163 [Cichorium intybus]
MGIAEDCDVISTLKDLSGNRHISAKMAGNMGLNESEEFVYIISTAEKWSELQTSRSTFGQNLDKDSGFIHLSKLNQIELEVIRGVDIIAFLSSPAGQLLKETAKALEQISLNLETHQVHESISLFYQV